MKHIIERLLDNKYLLLLVALSPIYYAVLQFLYRSKKMVLFYILLVSIVVQIVSLSQNII